MLPIINIIDCTNSGHSILSAGLQPVEAAFYIYIGDPGCREYREVSACGGYHIHIPMPYQLKRQNHSVAEALDNYSRRIADLLILRLRFDTAVTAHFDNSNWCTLALCLKAVMDIRIIFGYNGIDAPDHRMFAAADHIICSSGVARRRLLTNDPALAGQSTVLYPINAVARLDASAVVGRRCAWGLSPRDHLVVFNKKLVDPSYDMQPALQLFQRLSIPGARLFVLNEQEMGKYGTLVEKSAWTRINFIDALSDEETMECCSMADTVILPHLTERNFLQWLPLRQQGIPFVFDHDPAGNAWFQELSKADPLLFSAAAATEQLAAIYRQLSTSHLCKAGAC